MKQNTRHDLKVSRWLVHPEKPSIMLLSTEEELIKKRTKAYWGWGEKGKSVRRLLRRKDDTIVMHFNDIYKLL